MNISPRAFKSMSSPEASELEIFRSQASFFERSLNEKSRKRLGQYFTNVQLARLLAALAFLPEYKTTLDPMAGIGNLLDAAGERAHRSGVRLSHLDGIEIDSSAGIFCRGRLNACIEAYHHQDGLLVSGDVFAKITLENLPIKHYDLVITNPPYVRYQVLGKRESAKNSLRIEEIRKQLLAAILKYAPVQERLLWITLARSYSGLADLAVPAWILSALLVAPGGALAMVAPATWRSRDYAQIIHYLLLRCFDTITVVEDTGSGWFADALVRTTLIVARRLPSSELLIPLGRRNPDKMATQVVSIASSVQNDRSLVGEAFSGEDPDSAFASWVAEQKHAASIVQGISIKRRNLAHERIILYAKAETAAWLKHLESYRIATDTFARRTMVANALVPYAIRELMPENISFNVVRLRDVPVQVGQGLRTGGNVFFYVSFLKNKDSEQVRIKTSAALGSRIVLVPASSLLPVLRRQNELKSANVALDELAGRVFDLRKWVLPEDYPLILKNKNAYARVDQTIPEIMPEELADLVRRAAGVKMGHTPIPELSAVKTNTRAAKAHAMNVVPRFWYMLPDFTRRHLPDLFIPRINHRSPQVFLNCTPPVLIDANFSTLWTTDTCWTPSALFALLSSAWARVCMEAIGTPLGGGALKLEATQLRNLPLPQLTDDNLKDLHRLGEDLISQPKTLEEIDHLVVSSILAQTNYERREGQELVKEICKLINSLSQQRQRKNNA